LADEQNLTVVRVSPAHGTPRLSLAAKDLAGEFHVAGVERLEVAFVNTARSDDFGPGVDERGGRSDNPLWFDKQCGAMKHAAK
jgi:hypothetical protein